MEISSNKYCELHLALLLVVVANLSTPTWTEVFLGPASNLDDLYREPRYLADNHIVTTTLSRRFPIASTGFPFCFVCLPVNICTYNANRINSVWCLRRIIVSTFESAKIGVLDSVWWSNVVSYTVVKTAIIFLGYTVTGSTSKQIRRRLASTEKNPC